MKTRGFTLIEMIAVVFVLLAVMAIFVFNFAKQREGNALTVAQKMLEADLKLARDTASTNPNGASIATGPIKAGVGMTILMNGKIVRQDPLPPKITVSPWVTLAFKQNGALAVPSVTLYTLSVSGTGRTKQVYFNGNTGGISETGF